MKHSILWWNYKEQKHEEFAGPMPDDRWSEFIPQSPAYQNRFRLRIKMGLTPSESAIEIYNLMCGDNQND